ncbi:transmembrane protein 43 isoform X3 [Amblyomma americanum]
MTWTPRTFLTSRRWTPQRRWKTLSPRITACSLHTLLESHLWLQPSASCCGMRAGALSKALDQALEQVVHIEENDATPTNSTRLIHVTGHLSSHQEATDEAYNVSVAAVKLRRLVEMYQWVERSTYRQYADSDGIAMEQDFAYELDWRSELVDSTPFTRVSCVNPTEFPVKSKDFVLSEVQLGQLQLSDGLISMIDNFQPLDAVSSGEKAGKNFIYMTGSGGTPEKPQVGDVRISFFVAGILGPHGDKVSIVSECDGRHLRPFKSTAGVLVELLEFGDVTARPTPFPGYGCWCQLRARPWSSVSTPGSSWCCLAGHWPGLCTPCQRFSPASSPSSPRAGSTTKLSCRAANSFLHQFPHFANQFRRDCISLPGNLCTVDETGSVMFCFCFGSQK